ncbi:MAG: sensor histidine kinase, partial [Candidatus Binatia bacterium]
LVDDAWRRDSPAPAAAPVGAVQRPGSTVDARKQAAANADELAAEEKDASSYGVLRQLNKGAAERVQRLRQPEPQLAARGGRSDRVEMRRAPERGPTGGDQDLAADASPPRGLEERDAFADAQRENVAPQQDRSRAAASIEFAPMNGRAVGAAHLMLYRTLVQDTRGYRQGLVLDVDGLGAWLRAAGLGDDGLADFAQVSFATSVAGAPPDPVAGGFVFRHRFAEPFEALSASLALRPLPGGGSTAYIYALAGLLLAATGFGLAALYRMVAVMVGFAERRSNFVAAVSHELKTPLTAIRMYGEMLRDGMVPSEQKRAEYYRHITVESERLSRLINNVLEFSRLEKGTRAVALTSAPLAPVVREVAELLRPHAEGQGLTLQLDIDADLPPVRFEPDALMQVLWNLVDNAVKYAAGSSPPTIALRVWREGGRVHLAVRDHGPGVAARHLPHLFDPFYRGESELTRRNKGTGLGLALVRGLADAMDARVSARNPGDGGFEVDVTFAAG